VILGFKRFLAIGLLLSGFIQPVYAETPTREPLSDETGDGKTIPDMAYSSVVNDSIAGKVDEIFIRGTNSTFPTMYVRMKDGSIFQSVQPTYRLDDRIITSGVTVRADNEEGWKKIVSYIFQSTSFIIMLLSILILSMFARNMVGKTNRKGIKSTKGDKITFADVAGQDEAKAELQEIVEFLKNPSAYREIGAKAPRGVLLEGEPGNGKTLLGKAIAGEAMVPFFHINAPEILEMFAGLGARKIRQAFAECRKKSPCILFIDEIDTIGGKRGPSIGGDAQGEREQILNQLLVEMDGFDNNGTVLVIAATNRADTLDPALLRAGRFDRKIIVPAPHLLGREAIFAIHSQKVKLAPDVNLSEVARMTPGYSGADSANLVNEAAITAIRNKKTEVDMACFIEARDRILMGMAHTSRGKSADELEVASFHEAGHALVGLRQKACDPIHKITIMARGRALGAVIKLPERDYLLTSKERLMSDMAMTMGGRVAEEVIFGHDSITSGAQSDIRQATAIARQMVGTLGMSKKLGLMDYFGTGQFPQSSPETMTKIDEEVRDIINTAHSRALKIVTNELDGLKELARHLREVETMTGDEALKILDDVREKNRYKTIEEKGEKT
jgi:cell division protease FtsH